MTYGFFNCLGTAYALDVTRPPDASNTSSGVNVSAAASSVGAVVSDDAMSAVVSGVVSAVDSAPVGADASVAAAAASVESAGDEAGAAVAVVSDVASSESSPPQPTSKATVASKSAQVSSRRAAPRAGRGVSTNPPRFVRMNRAFVRPVPVGAKLPGRRVCVNYLYRCTNSEPFLRYALSAVSVEGADPVDARDDRGPTRIQSVTRALSILTTLALRPAGLTARELSEALEISRPTLYHLLRTLADDAFVTREADGRYRLGMRVGTLAEAFNRNLAPDERLRALLHRLADETGEAAYLVVRKGLEAVLVLAAQSTHAVAVTLPSPGVLEHAHARASGKVVLAFAPAEVQRDYLRTHRLERLTDHTVTEPDRLLAELADVRRLGYAVNRGEYAADASAMAAPIDWGTSPFVLALSAPSERFEQNVDRYLAVLLDVARSASTQAAVRALA